MPTDVAVIGGGLAGCATAWYLATEGVDVCLIEQADLNTRSSGANAGSIHAQIPHETFVVEGEDWARNFAPTLKLMVDSIAIWGGLSEALGADLEFAQIGGLLVAESEAQMVDIERKAAVERAQGVPIELLGRNGLRNLAPYVSQTMAGGAYCRLEGKANPLITTFAFARAAAREGAVFRLGTRVVAIDAGDGGFRISTDGGAIRARRVVNAAGTDAARVAAQVGVALHTDAHPLQVTVTEPVAPLVGHLVYFAGDKLTLKQTRGGALLIGGGWPSNHDPATGALAVDIDSVQRNVGVAAHVVPRSAGAEVLRTWPAFVAGTKDWRPILGEAPGAPDFHTVVFPWMGFTGGPIAARVVADLILGRSVAHDLSEFSVAHHQAASGGRETGQPANREVAR